MKPARRSLFMTTLIAAAVLSAAQVRADDASKPPTSPLDALKLVPGDERGNELKSLKTELLVRSTEKMAIQQAHKLIRKYRGTPLEPDLYFRLAELYMRESQSDEFFAIHRESSTVVRFAPRVVKEASSRRSIKNAIQTYALIQKRFPDFERMDLVIFNNAFADQTLDSNGLAEKLYHHLIEEYPDSTLVPDAHLAIGEIAFDQKQFSTALTHFNAIMKYPDSKVYPYGLYKAAWTYYNLRQTAKGLKKLEDVVAFGRYVQQNGIDARLDLRSEALKDMTLFFEDVYPSDKAYAYFSEQARGLKVAPFLLQLAELYGRHSRFQDQRVVLERFVDELSDSPLLPEVRTDLVWAYEHMRQKDKAVASLSAFADLCASSEWQKKPDCQSQLNDTALKLAKTYLHAWKKTPADTSYADASEKAFEIYLRTPGSSPDYAQSRYDYADLLFARKKFRQASGEYAAISKISGIPSKLQHDASYGALLSLEKAAGTNWSDTDEKSFHELAEDYLKKNPKGQYRLDVEYKMALLAYEKGRYAEAAPMFLSIGRKYASQDKGQQAQDLYLDILNIKKDYKGIREYAGHLMKVATQPARQQKMRKLYEQSYFMQIQGIEEKGDLKTAETEYLKFAKLNPQSDLAEKATWNAMQLDYKQGHPGDAAKLAEQFVQHYPKSKNATNALLRAAQTYEQMAQLGPAARVLEQLASRDAKSAHRWKDLAADFYALDGQPASARRLYRDLNETSKLAEFEKNYGTAETQKQVRREILAHGIEPQTDEFEVQRVEHLFDQGNNAEAFNQARHLLGLHMDSNHKARLRLIQARVLESEFMKQSVKTHADRVTTVLGLKTEKLQKAQEAFQSAIRYGDPKVSMQAFEELYNCYSAYVTALKTMPTPIGLTQSDALAFRAAIDKLLIPLEEKSVDTLAKAVDFAREQSFLDGTVTRLQAELDRLNHRSEFDVAPTLAKPGLILPDVAEAGS